MDKLNLTAEELRKKLNYNPKTGLFVRNYRNKKQPTGRYNAQGYIIVLLNNFTYSAHRLAWLHVHGEWPQGQIDHIDGERDNNRLKNLRVVTGAVNGQNMRKATKRSTSGLLGASRVKNGRWVSSISLNRTYHYLGIYATALEAHHAYIEAKRRLHVGCTI